MPSTTDTSHRMVASAILRLFEEIERGKEEFYIEVKERYELTFGKMKFIDDGDIFVHGHSHSSEDDEGTDSEDEAEEFHKEFMEQQLKEKEQKKLEKKKKKGTHIEDNEDIDKDIDLLKKSMQNQINEISENVPNENTNDQDDDDDGWADA